MNWMPIDTAPKGRELILYFPASERRAWGATTRVDVYPVYYPRQPTHWMPLPEPPEGA